MQTSTPVNDPSSSNSKPDLAELQAQLHETQSLLAAHIDKIRALEGVLAEHEAIKREVGASRGLVEGERRRVGDERDDMRDYLDGVEVVFDDDDDKRSN